MYMCREGERERARERAREKDLSKTPTPKMSLQNLNGPKP